MAPVKSPVYLFEKLGRYIGISTATGDFYDLSQETHAALGKWNSKLSNLSAGLTPGRAIELAAEENIPNDIIELFPLPDPGKETKEEFSASITDLTLNITSQCNLRCLYCWNDYGKYSNRDFHGQGSAQRSLDAAFEQMPEEIAFKAVDTLVKLSGNDRDLVVDFYGGEPLLNLKTLLSTVDYCRKNQKAWNAEFNFLLATNGTLLTPSVAEDLISRGVQIAVSIDGSKCVHDNNRPFASGEGTFDTIFSNLRKMPEKTLKRLVGRTTVTPSYPDMVELYKNLRSLGLERVELFESEDACHKITPQREAFFFSSDEQYKRLCKEYERLALHYAEETASGFLDYKKTFFNRFFKLMQRLYYNHELAGGCPAAVGQFAVSANGDMYPCTSFLGIEKFKFGNVLNGIDRARYEEFVSSINKRFTHCKECDLFMLCRTTGSCLNMNYYFNGDPSVPYQKSCDLFREKLQLAVATLSILSEKIPGRLEELFGFDAVGRRGNKLY